MSLLSRFLDGWRKTPLKPPTVHQVGIQARAIRHLIATGWIDARTVQRLGTTDAHKMFTRLRRIGLLSAANDPAGYRNVPNNHGVGHFREHRWTGKIPTNWERRKTPRGGRS